MRQERERASPVFSPTMFWEGVHMKPAAPNETVVDRKRVFLVDDHRVLREGLAELINHSADRAVCGEASSPEEALDRIPGAMPDLVVVDLALPVTGGMELLRTLKGRHPRVPRVGCSMHGGAASG